MAPTQQLLRSARPLLQSLTIKPTASAASKFSTSSRTAFRAQKAQTSFQFRFQAKNFFQNFGRSQKRRQSGAAGTGATGGGATGGQAKAEGTSWFNGPIGPKTVHFWAPVMKWALVLAGVSDFWRPAEKLSLTQNGALTATGIIWTRWCLIIKPKNYLLAAVNFFLGVVGVVQVTRILMWQQSVKGLTPAQQVEEAKDAAVDASKSLVNEVKNAV